MTVLKGSLKTKNLIFALLLSVFMMLPVRSSRSTTATLL